MRIAVVIALGLGLLATPVRAERLPFRAYGAADGLAGDHVRFIVQDSRGFLWLATNAGISRFDGDEFRNYGAADGIPFPAGRKVVEAPDGTLFVLGREKVARRPASPVPGKPEFEPVAPAGLSELVGDVMDIVLAPDGSLVLAGLRGAARLEGDRLTRIELGPAHVVKPDSADYVWAAVFDAGGALWVARTFGITRVGPDGGLRTTPLDWEHQVNSGWGWLPSMTVDRSGRVWLLTVGQGAWRLGEGSDGNPAIEEILGQDSGTASYVLLRALFEDAEGTLWIGTSDRGLLRAERSSAGRRFVPIGPAEGFPDNEVFALNEDAQGNLWFGTAVSGVVRLTAGGLTSWGASEGITPTTIYALNEDPRDGIIAELPGLQFVALKNGRISRLGTPLGLERDAGWGNEQIVATGTDGRLWVASGMGLAVYASGTAIRDLATRKPDRVFDTRDGMPLPYVHRVFVAGDGTVWFGLLQTASGVCRVGGDGRGLRCFGSTEGLPAPAEGAAFAEDGDGNIWIGLYGGGLYRFRDGRFETWSEIAPEKQTSIRSIRRDAAGRLWVAGMPGVLRIDAPASPQPSFRRFSIETGLASVDSWAIVDDSFGRVYVGTAHGVDRMNEDGGAIRRFTTADGLPSNRVTILLRDREGVIWVGTSRGVAKLVPESDPGAVPPRVYLTGVRVAGMERAASRPLRLESDERTVDFTFSAPSFRAGETMRFQWRLHGASDVWSPPGSARAITLAGLSPGSYRFEVRAIDGDGLVSAPASLELAIRPPVWQRGWFLGLLAISAAALASVLYRVRVTRLVELERVRTRIATDLHDDIGASLSQIAVLSQYASRQAARGSAETGRSLDRITELSGAVVDAMSDVVWSINPARDRMSDLVHRMRRFAVDLFADGDVSLKLDLPDDAADDALDPEARRQVYLVFKEALRNAARHAGALEVEAALRREGDGLLLAVKDDGGGIEAATRSGGAGLDSMRGRATRLGGTLEIRGREGGGTEVLLRIPNTRRRFLARWMAPRKTRAS